MSSGKLESRMLTVLGVVQRVGFRRFSERAARECGVKGFVQNQRDGSVKLVVQGEARTIEKFVDAINNAPQPIIVDSVESKKIPLGQRFKTFSIKSGALADELQEGLGAMEAQFSDYRSEFKEYRLEFRSFSDRTDSNFKSMDTKYGEIFAKLTEILKSLQTENVEAIKSLNRSVDSLEKTVDRLLLDKNGHQSGSVH